VSNSPDRGARRPRTGRTSPQVRAGRRRAHPARQCKADTGARGAPVASSVQLAPSRRGVRLARRCRRQLPVWTRSLPARGVAGADIAAASVPGLALAGRRYRQGCAAERRRARGQRVTTSMVQGVTNYHDSRRGPCARVARGTTVLRREIRISDDPRVQRRARARRVSCHSADCWGVSGQPHSTRRGVCSAPIGVGAALGACRRRTHPASNWKWIFETRKPIVSAFCPAPSGTGCHPAARAAGLAWEAYEPSVQPVQSPILARRAPSSNQACAARAAEPARP
jgi:hypothetical protein